MIRVLTSRPMLVALATAAIPMLADAQGVQLPAIDSAYAGTTVTLVAPGLASARLVTSDPTVAWVDTDGQLQFAREGRVVISAVSTTDSVGREIVVRRNPAARIDLAVDGTRIRAVALDADGHRLASVPVTVAVNGAMVRADANGMALVGARPGPVVVIAQSGEAAASAIVTVADAGVVQQGSTTVAADPRTNPVRKLVLRANADGDVVVGDTVQLRADAWAAGGRRVMHPDILYAIAGANGIAASVTPDGRFVAKEPGVYTIIAASGIYADRQTVFVAAHR